MQHLAGYTVALLGLLSLPGPTNALLAASGATVGVARSVALLVWELLAYLTAIAVERALLMPAIERLPGATRLLDGLAALYLVCLAFVLWRSRVGVGAQGVRAHQLIVTTLLNPKGLIIAVLIMPLRSATLHPVAGMLGDWALLSAAIPLSGLIWLGAGRYVQRIAAPQLARLVPRAASLALGLFALLLIVRMLR